MKDKTIQAAKALWKCMKEEGIGEGTINDDGWFRAWEPSGKMTYKNELSTIPDPKPETDYPQTLADLLEWMREYGKQHEEVWIKIWEDGAFSLCSRFGDKFFLDDTNILTDLPPIKPDPVQDFLKNDNSIGWPTDEEREAVKKYHHYLQQNDLLK